MCPNVGDFVKDASKANFQWQKCINFVCYKLRETYFIYVIRIIVSLLRTLLHIHLKSLHGS